MINALKPEYSFTSWYPLFKKDALRATILPIPNDVLQYLLRDTFVLPIEASNSLENDSMWHDGSPVNEEEDSEPQPTFPDFSNEIQTVLDEYGAVFIKSNWSSPLDATWVAPTKTLKCQTLEEIYLLLKSSDRILRDLSEDGQTAESRSVQLCLVLKQWLDINPCTEFRCFVIDNELIGISQRDISQYHTYNESEKFNVRTDIKSLFAERIKDRFKLNDYSFDVVRFKKDKVKIVDFGPLDESATRNTLFTYEELLNVNDAPEFRFIGEEIGIQPKTTSPVCVPQEINEFFRTSDKSLLGFIQSAVETQRNEDDEANVNT